MREHSSYFILNSYFGYHCSLQHNDHLAFTCTGPYLPAESASCFTDKQCNHSFSDWNIGGYVFSMIDSRFCWTVAVVVYGQTNMIIVCCLIAYSLLFCLSIRFVRIHSKLDRRVPDFDELALIEWIFYSYFLRFEVHFFIVINYLLKEHYHLL